MQSKSLFTRFAGFVFPFALALFNYWAWQRLDTSHRLSAQVWTGLLALGGLAYASGLLPHQHLKPAHLFSLPRSVPEQHPWVVWTLMALWTMAWTIAWLTLPSGNFLKLVLPTAFFALVWGCLGPVEAMNVAVRGSMALTLAAIAAWFGVLLLNSPFRLARLLGDWSGRLDAAGRHYEHVQVLKTWSLLRIWGPSHAPLTDVRFGSSGLELLQWMGSVGALPGILVGVTLVLGWAAVWSWLRRVAPGPGYSIELRRMGLALVALHGLATLSYVLFNMGLTRHSAGLGLPPFVPQAAWWLLGAALVWIVVKAVRVARSVQAEVPGRRWWISLVGYAMVGLVFATGVLVIKENQRNDQTGDLSNRAAFATREVIRDANNNVIAQNVLAYDLWFIPTEFWAPSLLNARDSAQQDNGYEAKRTDAERERLLLHSLGKWPQVQDVVRARLALWPRAKDSQAILVWAITPEVADAIKALAMPGVLIKPRTARRYPDGPLYAHALGFASLADTQHGQEGLELVANRQLATVAANACANDRYGVQTTLVPDIQKAARDTLQAGIQAHNAKGGAIVVIDVGKNEIAAMVSAPDFDPNNLSTYRNPYQPDRILNRATSLSFPIGELISPLLAAHGIESGRVPAPANVTLAELQGISKTLGLGEPLGIPGLTGGAIAERKDWSEWTPAMHANPGKAIETNLMQVLKAYLPIATSGYLRTPTLLTSAHGDMYGKRVLSPETAAAMRQALKLVASNRGTAPVAQESGASVAGKMTAMTGNLWSDPVSGKRSSRSDTSVFVGMLPAEQPKWLVGVLLEYQTGKAEPAGLSTAPMFTHLARLALSPLVGERQAASSNAAH